MSFAKSVAMIAESRKARLGFAKSFSGLAKISVRP
jgi:hypothetical protein